MKDYLIAVITASFAASLCGILSPRGEKNGIASHVRLLTSLFLIAVLAAPLSGLLSGLRAVADGEISLPGIPAENEETLREGMERAMDSASETYVAETLTRILTERFDLGEGNLRLRVVWDETEERAVPREVTVILSGKDIWKNPTEITDYVTELLGCPAESAIE